MSTNGLPSIEENSIVKNSIDNISEKKERFSKPTLEEIRNYIEEKNLNVNADDFYQYFEEGNWIDSKGNKVKNWKQKLLTWNKYKTNAKATPKQSFNQEIDKSVLDSLYDNM